MNRAFLGLGFLVLAPLCALAEADKMNIAVNDLQGKGVSTAEAEVISDRLRSELVKTGVFRVMERGEMETILKEQGFQQSGMCDDAACLVEVGQLLGVRRMLAGTIGKIGSTYTLSARMIEVKTGEVVSVANADIRGSIDLVLTEATRKVARELAGAAAPAEQGAAAKAPPPAEKTPSQKQTAPPAPVKPRKSAPAMPVKTREQPRREKSVMVGFGLSSVLPLRDLADGDYDGGYAVTGGGGQFDMFVRPWRPPIALRFHMGYQRNGVDVDEMEWHSQEVAEDLFYGSGTSVDVSLEAGGFHALAFLWGGQFRLGRKFGFYVDAVAGMCITVTPWVSMTMDFYDEATYSRVTEEDWIDPEAEQGFAFSAAVGAILVRHLDIGIRFMYWPTEKWAPGSKYAVLKPTIAVRF
jgi:TolB-like protein